MQVDIPKNHSLDAIVVETLNRERDSIRVKAKVEIPEKEIYEYLALEIKDEAADVTLRSRIARLGFNSDVSTKSYQLNSRRQEIEFEATINPYSRKMVPQDMDWTEPFSDKGRALGKIVHFPDENKLTKYEIDELIAQEKIRLPEGSYVEDNGDVYFKLHNRVHEPDISKLEINSFIDALSVAPRSNIIALQPKADTAEAGGGLLVPKDEGSVGYTEVMPGEFSIILKKDQGKGVMHTSARHIMPHSSPGMYVELIGNGREDVRQDFVVGNFYRNDYVSVDRPSVINGIRLHQIAARDKLVHKLLSHPEKIVWWKDLGDGPELEEIVNLLDPDEKGSVYRARTNIKKLPQKNPKLYFSRFPTDEIWDRIADQANDHKKIGALIFYNPPNNNNTFSTSTYEAMKSKASKMNFIWDHPAFDEPLVFHDTGFMKESDINYYNKAARAGHVIAAFGSGMKAEEGVIIDAQLAFEDFYRFIGGKGSQGYIVGGGGPNMMEVFAEEAHKRGLKSGAIQIYKEGETQVSQADLMMPFSRDDIHTRQKTMVDLASAYLIFQGGAGTAYEFFEALTKNSIGFYDKPIIVVGDQKQFVRKLSSLVDEGVKEGVIRPDAGTTVYQVDSGDQVFDTLIKHYQLQSPNVA